MKTFRFFDKSRLRRIDKNNFDIKDSEIISFSCVRNEILRLPYFLEYHRKLGVDRFIFIDNASTDGTKEYLLSQHDSNVFYTKASYASSKCGIDWLNQLLSEYGSNHWILTLEPDELLVYPLCERVNLPKLTKYLDATGAQAMKTLLIDMYSDKAIKDTCYKAGESFLKYCRYFDRNSYSQLDEDNIATIGGPRARLFWEGYNREKPSPYLVNVPLIKWRHDLNYVSGTHFMSDVKLAALTGVKQHFKFFSDFYEYAEAEASRKEHWDNASEYVTYWEVLSKNPHLCAMYHDSLKYTDSIQLVGLGLMNLTDDYSSFVSEC